MSFQWCMYHFSWYILISSPVTKRWGTASSWVSFQVEETPITSFGLWVQAAWGGQNCYKDTENTPEKGQKHLLLRPLIPQSPRTPEPIAEGNRQRSTSKHQGCLTSLQISFRTIIIWVSQIAHLVLCSRNKHHSPTRNLLSRKKRTIVPLYRKNHHRSWIIHHHLSTQMVQQSSYLQKWWAKNLL